MNLCDKCAVCSKSLYIVHCTHTKKPQCICDGNHNVYGIDIQYSSAQLIYRETGRMKLQFNLN